MKEVIKMNNNIKAPCRYDFVGSFLRPDYLKKARADFEKGTITAEQLKEEEDKAILDLVAKQKKAGYHIITDGEFRRATWHLDFMWGFNGVGHSKTQTGLPFHGEAAMIDDTSQARYQLATTHLLSISSSLRLSRTRTQSQSRLSLHLHSSLSR